MWTKTLIVPFWAGCLRKRYLNLSLLEMVLLIEEKRWCGIHLQVRLLSELLILWQVLSTTVKAGEVSLNMSFLKFKVMSPWYELLPHSKLPILWVSSCRHCFRKQPQKAALCNKRVVGLLLTLSDLVVYVDKHGHRNQADSTQWQAFHWPAIGWTVTSAVLYCVRCHGIALIKTPSLPINVCLRFGTFF